MKISLQFDGTTYDIEFDGDAILVDGERFLHSAQGIQLGEAWISCTATQGVATFPDGNKPYTVHAIHGFGGQGEKGGSSGDVKPPMTGRLVELRVNEGDEVAVGETLFVLEAMKMLNQVKSPVAGTVHAIHGKPGDTLEPSDVLVQIR